MTLLHDTAALTCWRAKRSKIKLSPKGKCYFKVLATWGKTRPDFNKPSWRFGAKIVPHKMSHGMSNKWSIEPLSRIFDDVERSYWAKSCSVKLLLLSLLRRKPKGLHRRSTPQRKLFCTLLPSPHPPSLWAQCAWCSHLKSLRVVLLRSSQSLQQLRTNATEFSLHPTI